MDRKNDRGSQQVFQLRAQLGDRVAKAALRGFFRHAGRFGDFGDRHPALLLHQEGFALRRRERADRGADSRGDSVRFGADFRLLCARSGLGRDDIVGRVVGVTRDPFGPSFGAIEIDQPVVREPVQVRGEFRGGLVLRADADQAGPYVVGQFFGSAAGSMAQQVTEYAAAMPLVQLVECGDFACRVAQHQFFVCSLGITLAPGHRKRSMRNIDARSNCGCNVRRTLSTCWSSAARPADSAPRRSWNTRTGQRMIKRPGGSAHRGSGTNPYVGSRGKGRGCGFRHA